MFNSIVLLEYIKPCHPLLQQACLSSTTKSLTAGKMRSQILVVVIFLVVVTTLEANGFQFGDIISFKTRCKGNFKYKHFAVYVGEGNQHNLPKNDNEDIYERLRFSIPPKCVFSRMNPDEQPEVNNYLDGYTDPKTHITFEKGNDAEIRARIIETHNKCSLYEVFSNNCEHQATYVRYGHKIALQFKLTGQGYCFNNPRINTKALVEHLNEPCGSDPHG